MYRQEWKIEIDPGDLWELRQRLGQICRSDPHGKNGAYQVRSLYFDTPEDAALWEKLDGVNRREKFRLRYYDEDLSYLQLEKKEKIGGLCRKTQEPVTARQVRRLLSGEWDWMLSAGELSAELYSKMAASLLRPKVRVDYTREAFLYPAGNVRVTLDTGIRACYETDRFLDPAAVTLPAGGAPALMEIKFDAFLPDIIRDAAALTGRRASAFSKYAQCRLYG